MKNSSHLGIYILINILISAITTLTVLWLWEQAHPRPQLITLPESTLPSQNNDPVQPTTIQDNPADTEPTSEPTLEFISEDIKVTIRVVVGAGNLDVEYVEIYNQSEGPVDLTGWQLVDEDGHSFTFPTLILNSGGAIKVLSKSGDNTVIELYWQADAPIWQSGENVRLLNADGDLIASYSIP